MLLSAYGNFLLRIAGVSQIMPGECGVDQGQSADAPEEHQQDENALRQDSQLRRQPQRQAHRTGGGRCFIETGAEGKLLRCADGRRARKGQPQIQQQNGGGVADGGVFQSAVEELRKTVLEAPGITGQELYKAVSLAGDKLLENWGVAENYEQEKNEYQMLCTLSGTPEELFQRLYALALRLLDETIRRRAGDEPHPFLMAKQFMEKQYMDNISLEQVASIAGFSPNYFSSQFKQETGMGFQDYLTMLRINRAKELLRSTNLSISEVCYQVGYQDIRTFNRVFKRVAALRPGEFKKLYGTSGGPVR